MNVRMCEERAREKKAIGFMFPISSGAFLMVNDRSSVALCDRSSFPILLSIFPGRVTGMVFLLF